MRAINFLFSFQGRIPRDAFWATFLGIFVIVAAAGGVMDAFAGTDGNSPYDNIIVVLLLPCMWIGLATQVKRWHDRGHSGWRVLINAIPVIGSIWTLVELGFLKGTTGTNRFGPDPLQVAAQAKTAVRPV